MSEINDHMLAYRSYFDDGEGRLVEWWELYHYSRNWRGKWGWRPKTELAYDGIGATKFRIKGDEAWANRVAVHYGIKVPSSKRGGEKN